MKIFHLFLFLVICTLLSACSVQKIDFDETSVETIRDYVEAVVEKKYDEAYSKLHPVIREEESIEIFVNNIRKSEEMYGEVTAIKIKENVKMIDENFYEFEVIFATPTKYVVQRIELLKDNDIWYLNKVIPLGYQERKKSIE